MTVAYRSSVIAPAFVASVSLSGGNVDGAEQLLREASSSACAQATTDAIEAIGALLDRIQADPSAVLAGGDEIGDIFEELGFTTGQACGEEGAGTALSEIIVYLGSEAATKPEPAASYATGMLGELCSSASSFPLQLTPAGATRVPRHDSGDGHHHVRSDPAGDA